MSPLSPFVGLLIKQLPRLIPVVESLVTKSNAPRPAAEDRIALLVDDIDRLQARSERLEAKLTRMTRLAAIAVLLALAALIAAFVR